MGLEQSTRYDPLAVFRESKTPTGLYARKRWLEESSRSWKTGFQETVEFLKAGQDRDGSWNHSVLETVKRLFAGSISRFGSPMMPLTGAWTGSQNDFELFKGKGVIFLANR